MEGLILSNLIQEAIATDMFLLIIILSVVNLAATCHFN